MNLRTVFGLAQVLADKATEAKAAKKMRMRVLILMAILKLVGIYVSRREEPLLYCLLTSCFWAKSKYLVDSIIVVFFSWTGTVQGVVNAATKVDHLLLELLFASV